MNISTRAMLSACVLGASLTAAAQTAETRVVSVSLETGSYASYTGSAGWADQWLSTATDPQLIISSTDNAGGKANNFNKGVTSGDLQFYVGQKPPTTLTLTTNNGDWVVTGFSFTGVMGSSSVNIAVGDKTYSTTATGVPVEASFPVDATEPAAMVFTGDNVGTTLKDFTVTLTYNPAAIATTTIANGDFAAETVWYHMQASEGDRYTYYKEGGSHMAFGDTDPDYADNFLWCFTGSRSEGYQVYNKKAGASAAVTTARVNADGRLLADANQSVTFAATWAQQTLGISLSNGTFARADGSTSSSDTWQASITRQGNPSLRLYAGKNNLNKSTLGIATGMENSAWTFGTDEGYYVTAFSFDYERDSEYGASVENTITVGDKAEVVGTQKAHAGMSGLTANDAATFTYTGTNSNVILLTNIQATIRRGSPEKLGYEIFKYTGTAPYELCYRIPAITTVENGAHKGRIIAVNDYRHNGTQDIQNGNTLDIKISVSDDNGKTWSEPAIPVNKAGEQVAKGQGTTEGENNANKHWDCAFGDACIVSDRESGKILMMAVGGPVNFFRSTRSNPNQIVRWYSEDGGDTWTNADCFTEEFLSIFDNRVPNGQIQGQFIGSGRIMQSRYIKVGQYYRIYAVSSANKAKDNGTSNYVMYSDDFGMTWEILGDPKEPAVPSNADEPKAEELPDGSVLLAARAQGGNRNFNIWRYTDVAKAEGKWDSHFNTNCGQGSINACNGEIMILPVVDNDTEQPTYLALQSFPYGGSRSNVSIIYKSLNGYDDIARPSAFATWEGRYQVSSIGSAYSTMCWQHNETLGFLYEEETYGKQYTGVYRNLTIEQITRGRYSYKADADGSVAQRITRDLIEGRVTNEADSRDGRYVGEPKVVSANADAVKAAEAWKSAPTVENYLKFNAAMLSGGGSSTEPVELIEAAHAGIYRVISAHEGTYAAFAADRFLAHDGTQLTTTDTDSELSARWILLHKPGTTENWVLYNSDSKRYVAASPAQTETAFSLTANLDQAGVYTLESDTDGHSVFTCTAPGNSSYASLHMNSSGKPVIWTSDATASRWFVELTGTATDDQLPAEFIETGISEITGDDAVAARLYDLMGRPVAAPVAGGLYVTSSGRKFRL